MRKKTNRGSIIAMALIISLVLSISGLTLLTTVRYTSTEVQVDEVKRTKSYYASLAGLRYASIWLNSKDSDGKLDPDETYTVTSSNPKDGWARLFNDLQLSREGLVLKIEIEQIERDGKADQSKVTAVCR